MICAAFGYFFLYVSFFWNLHVFPQNRIGACSSPLWRLTALLPETFGCLGLYSRGPKGDMRPLQGVILIRMCQECQTPRAEAKRTTGKVTEYTFNQSLWRLPRDLHRIRSKLSFCKLCFGRISALLSELASLSFCDWGGLLQALYHKEPFFHQPWSPQCLSQRLLGSSATVPEFLLLFLFTEVHQEVESFTF